MSGQRIALVPGVPALLPRYASVDDPVADLRAACLRAVRELGPRVVVVPDGPGWKVGAQLVASAGAQVVPAAVATGVLVVGNGTATRTEKAPGHFDERAEAFDGALRAALVAPDPAALGAIDLGLAADLWADPAGLTRLERLLSPGRVARVHYDDAPFGVQYWVISWL